MIKYQPRPKGVNSKQRTTTSQTRARKQRSLLPEADRRQSFPQWPLPGDEEMV